METKMKRITIDFERLKGAVAGKQQELAEELGISQASMSFWINGKRRLTLDDLNRIAEALGRNTGDFLRFDDQILRDIRKAAWKAA